MTNLVKPLSNAGNGTYTVADIQSMTGKTSFAGWSLIVAYRNPSESMKNMSIFDGLVNIGTGAKRDITVSGFQTPEAGPVNAEVGFVTWEGDLGIVGDSASLNGKLLSDAQHPKNNFFNSRISHNGVLDVDRNPAYANSLGFEAAWMAPPAGGVKNRDTSATIRVETAGDNFVPGVITFQTEIYSPRIDQTKAAIDVNGGKFEQGDVITYRIAGKNTGQDGTANFVLRDSIPTNTTYVPGSIRIVKNAGATTGPRTDVAGDDTAEFDAANKRIIARLGQGANANVGGDVAPGAEYEVTFQVKVNGPDISPVPNLTVIENQTVATLNAKTTGGPVIAESDADVTVSSPDLRIKKTRTGSDFVAGETSQYTLAVDNHGDAKTQGTVTVSDPLANGLTAVGVNAPGWSCNSLPAPQLTCSRSDALAPGTHYPDIVVTVKIGHDVTAELENIATVSGGGDASLGDNTSSSTNPVDQLADLAIAKTASADQVKIGDIFSYALKVTNNGPSQATSVAVTDQIPAGLSFLSADPGCVHEPVNGTVICELGAMATGASQTVNVTVKVDGDAAGQIRNIASVSAQQQDPDPSNNTDEEIIDARGADLQVTKALKSPAAARTGDTVTYEVVVRNNGPSDATGVVLYDALPVGLTDVATDNGDCTVVGGSIICPLGDIANGDSVTIEVTGKVKPGQQELINNVNATGNEYDPDPSNNSDSVTSPVGQVADLEIVKSADKGSVLAGGELVYRFKVTNKGPDSVTDAVISDSLPNGVTFVDGDSSCDTAGQVVTCTVGSLASGDSVLFEITVKVTPAAVGPVENTADVSSSTPDPDPDNNTSTATTPVVKNADLGIVKTKTSPAHIKTGDTVTYELVITNHGPLNATGVTVTDALPQGLTGVATDNNDCDVTGDTITCDLGALTNGGSVTILVTGKVKPGQSNLVNTANVNGDQPDPNPANDNSKTDDPVSQVADLGIVKKANKAEVPLGGTLVYTFHVTNDGPDDASAVKIVDTLPADLTYVGGAPGCNASGQQVTCIVDFLAVDGSTQIDITVKVGSGVSDRIANTAKVGSESEDPNPDNDSSTVTAPVIRDTDVAIIKTVDNHSPDAGDTVIYTLTANNNGPASAENVVVTDQLPEGVTFVSADAPCTESGGKITCVLGTLEPGEEVALKVKVKVDPWAPAVIDGPRGIDVQKVESQIDLNPGETRTIQAQCPTGFFVSDGSVRIDHIDQGTGNWMSPQVTESRASDNRTWQGTVTNTATGRVQAKIFAVCIRETTTPNSNSHDLQVSEPVVTTISLETGDNVAMLECPAGTVAIQPGFIADSPGHMVYSQPEGNGWKFVYRTDTDQPDDQVRFSIRCLDEQVTVIDDHSHDLALKRIWIEQPIQPGQVQEVQLTCPDGSKGIVGGWDLDPGLVSLGNDPRPVTRAFKVYNPTDEPLTVRYSLLCLGDITGSGGSGIDTKDITNTAEIRTSSPETDIDNNDSSVTITAGPSTGSGAAPGGNKPGGNNAPGVKKPGTARRVFVIGAFKFRNGKLTGKVKANRQTRGLVRLVTAKRVRVNGRKFAKGTVIAKGHRSIRTGRFGKLNLRVTGQGKRILRKTGLKRGKLKVAGVPARPIRLKR